MQTKRAIFIGILIWCIGVFLFSASYYVPLLENLEFQSNLVLSLSIIPLVWCGCYFYYKKEQQTNGFITGLIFLLTAILLDAVITVPFLIIPNGGNYYDFFIDFGFWLIAAEFIFTANLYFFLKVKPILHKNI